MQYLRDVIQGCVRISLATLGAALLNLFLLHAGEIAWRLYGETHTGAHFSTMNPALHALINDVLAMQPYWQTSIDLALAAMLCVLIVIPVLQASGLLRLLYDPLPWVLRLLLPVALLMVFAPLYASFDAELDSYRAYICLLLPGMFCVLWPGMRALRAVVPDVAVLFSAVVRHRA